MAESPDAMDIAKTRLGDTGVVCVAEQPMRQEETRQLCVCLSFFLLQGYLQLVRLQLHVHAEKADTADPCSTLV